MEALKETSGRPQFPCPPRGAGWAQPGPGGMLKESVLRILIPRRNLHGSLGVTTRWLIHQSIAELRDTRRWVPTRNE